MATIRKHAIRLDVNEAEAIINILQDFSRSQYSHARRTSSASIRAYCYDSGRKAQDLTESLIRRLYSGNEATTP